MLLASKDKQPDPDTLVLLKICRDQVESMSIRSMLGAEGIEVFIHGENHRAMGGALLGAVLELRAMVRFSDLEDARDLIQELDYAEHLPAEEVEADPDDRSLQQFQSREIETVDTGRSSDKAALLAVVLPFGAGHFYAGHRGFAAGIAALQLLNLGLALQGWAVWRMAIAAVLFDAVFSGVAIRRDRQRAKLQD